MADALLGVRALVNVVIIAKHNIYVRYRTD